MEEIHKLRAQISNIVKANFPDLDVGFVQGIKPPSELQVCDHLPSQRFLLILRPTGKGPTTIDLRFLYRPSCCSQRSCPAVIHIWEQVRVLERYPISSIGSGRRRIYSPQFSDILKSATRLHCVPRSRAIESIVVEM